MPYDAPIASLDIREPMSRDAAMEILSEHTRRVVDHWRAKFPAERRRSAVIGWVQGPIAAILPASASERVFSTLVDVAAVLAVALPGVMLAVLIYATGKPFTDTETRRRQCGYVLRGLTEPRCPECGEGI